MSTTTRVIQQLDQTINSFESQVDVKVGAVRTSTDNVQVTVDKIYQNIENFRTNMMEGEEKQLAHENVIRIDQIIKEQFSDHEEIRRTVMGIVRDFDINLVRNSTIKELSEELWITSSRYWLSYALIAVTAWVNDFPKVANNAMAESGRLEPVKTTLFFCLLNLRFGRMEAAKLWFYEYFKTLDPTVLQPETAVLLQAFLNGAFGKDKELEQQVIDLLDSWVVQLKENEEISEEIQTAYATYVENLNPRDKGDYKGLLEFSSAADSVEASHREISKYNMLLDFVSQLDVETQPQEDENYKSRIDAILINLISNYDEEEAELKRQQEYYQLVIENDGQIEAAESQFQAREALREENFNFGRQLITWSLYDKGVNIHVRKFAFQNTRRWFLDAVNSWHDKVVDACPREFPLAIDTWTGVTSGKDHTEQQQSMDNFYENTKFNNMYINNANIAALIILVLSLGLAFVSVFTLVGAVCAGAFLIYRVMKARREYPVRIENAKKNLQLCLDEIVAFQQYFEENSAKKETLISKVKFL